MGFSRLWSPLFAVFLIPGMLALYGDSSDSSSSDIYGHLLHGEKCDPTPHQTDLSALCDASRRLSCDPFTHRCKCHHELRDFYSHENEQCETRVGFMCGPGDTFPAICTEHAKCNQFTRFCECKDGFEPSIDGTACNGVGYIISSFTFVITMCSLVAYARV